MPQVCALCFQTAYFFMECDTCKREFCNKCGICILSPEPREYNFVWRKDLGKYHYPLHLQTDRCKQCYDKNTKFLKL